VNYDLRSIRSVSAALFLCASTLSSSRFFYFASSFVESGMMLERGRGFKGDWLYSVDECLESDSPAVDCDVAGHNDLPRRSFEEAVPYKSWQPADLPDIFKQRCETGVQTEVTESSTLLLEN